MTRSIRFVLAVACVAVLIFSFGCGHRPAPTEKERTRVKGIVTLDGKPLAGGTITFISIDNPKFRVSTVLGPNGFTVADAPRGPVRVSVETESSKIANGTNYVRIPAKYGNVETSGLKTTISEGGELQPFELKSK